MFKILLTTLLAFPFIVSAQNSPNCDSVFIKCCDFNLTDTTLSLLAANHSPYLFDYPGFLITDQNNDTVAKETVNYFGIGTGYQEHVLDLLAPMELPFTGNLLLFTLFYDSLHCNFPIYIPDTVTSLDNKLYSDEFEIYPNPAQTVINITFGGKHKVQETDLFISDNAGRVVYRKPGVSENTQIKVSEIGKPGIYFIRIQNPRGEIIRIEKLIIR